MQKVAGERYVYKFVCDPEALFALAYGVTNASVSAAAVVAASGGGVNPNGSGNGGCAASLAVSLSSPSLGDIPLKGDLSENIYYNYGYSASASMNHHHFSHQNHYSTGPAFPPPHASPYTQHHSHYEDFFLNARRSSIPPMEPTR